MPAGVHGSGPGRPHDQAAEVHRVQPVDVLGGVDGQQGRAPRRGPAGSGSWTR